MGSREGVAPWCPIMLDECGGKLTEDGAAHETRHLVYSCRLGPNDTYTRLCLQVFDLLFIESEFYWKLRRQDCECAPGVIRKVARASHAARMRGNVLAAGRVGAPTIPCLLEKRKRSS